MLLDPEHCFLLLALETLWSDRSEAYHMSHLPTFEPPNLLYDLEPFRPPLLSGAAC